MTTTTTDEADAAVRRAAALRLVARTTRVAAGGRPAAGLDLLAAAGADGILWHHDSLALAGRGQALRIRLPGGLADTAGVEAVRAILATIEAHDEVGLPGCGPVAVGALAFDRSADGGLVVPEVLLGRRGDDAWITTVTAEGGPGGGPVGPLRDAMLDDARSGRRPTVEAPDEFRLVSSVPQAEWRAIVADAVEHIQAGELDKVVLARQIAVEADRPIDTGEVLARLLALYPACMVFRVGGFVGASPELLVERRGTQVRSQPLAGTIPRSGDLVADEALVAGLFASAKDRREHRFVIDGLRAALQPVCATLDIPDQPSILELRNVSHLATSVAGELVVGSDGGPPTALELVARLHPTAAVGGTPTAVAEAYRARHEGLDRGRYAGPVGWVDARGDGTWAVGIRSADITANRARLYAGVGIVAGSDPRAELAETQLKLQALLAAVVRP
jgi:menaquinone-specific isochorismate synthase